MDYNIYRIHYDVSFGTKWAIVSAASKLSAVNILRARYLEDFNRDKPPESRKNLENLKDIFSIDLIDQTFFKSDKEGMIHWDG